jgi:predicted ATP-grasp superfamily ATP-dependent carboligase
LDPSTPAVVLGIHHGSLGIARSLGRLGVPVHGVDADLRARAFASRYFRDRHVWDFARAPAADSVGFLLELRRQLGREAVLIPISDDLTQLVADHAAELRAAYRFQDNPPELVRSLRRKSELHELARRLGVPTPETLFPRSVEDVRRFAAEVTFPLMLKASDGLRLEARAGRKMVLVRSADELLEQYARLEDPADPNLMLQEYIPGGDDTIWMFNGYFDSRSDCVAGFTGKKLRQHPIHTGATSLGVCLRNPVVHDLTTGFMKKLGYRGILDIGFRYDARDGFYKLLDPNPRIGSTFRLFVGNDGTDVARLLYLDLTGQPFPSTSQVEGRKWVVEDQDLVSTLGYRREGSLTWGAWLRSYRGVREAAWFAADDLKPFLLLARDLLRRAFRRLLARKTH